MIEITNKIIEFKIIDSNEEVESKDFRKEFEELCEKGMEVAEEHIKKFEEAWINFEYYSNSILSSLKKSLCT